MPGVGTRQGLEPYDDAAGGPNHAGLIRLVELLARQAVHDVMRAGSAANAADDRHHADVLPPAHAQRGHS
jgi:hypothetical protein